MYLEAHENAGVLVCHNVDNPTDLELTDEDKMMIHEHMRKCLQRKLM